MSWYSGTQVISALRDGVHDFVEASILVFAGMLAAFCIAGILVVTRNPAAASGSAAPETGNGSAESGTEFRLTVQLSATSLSPSRTAQRGLLAHTWIAAFNELMAMPTVFLVTASDAMDLVCEEMAALKYHLQNYHAGGTFAAMNLGATHLQACMAITAERVQRLKVRCSCSTRKLFCDIVHLDLSPHYALFLCPLRLHIHSMPVMPGQLAILMTQRSSSVEGTCEDQKHFDSNCSQFSVVQLP